MFFRVFFFVFLEEYNANLKFIFQINLICFYNTYKIARVKGIVFWSMDFKKPLVIHHV